MQNFPETAIEWLDKLISFDTTSSHSNLNLIYYVRDYFISQNILFEMTYDENREKANIFATFPAADGSRQNGIVLSGHTDVVPITGQNWSNNPFKAVIKNQRIYGRGACDMKGFLSVLLALVPRFQSEKLKLPIHFAFSYDEEIGCLGAQVLIASLIENNIRPQACIVGEPTDMKIIIGHKGANSFHCKIKGMAAHSSLTPQGCNAIEYAASLIAWLRNLSKDLKTTLIDDLFDVPYTTLSTNTIHGGIANNIIPAFCEFVCDLRNLPTVSAEKIIAQIQEYIKNELLPQIKKEHQDAGIEIDEIVMVPAFTGSLHHPLLNRALEKLSMQHTDLRKVAYATEAGLFEKANIPTFICGPGNIEQAHRADEFVEIAQLEKCEKFLLKLLV